MSTKHIRLFEDNEEFEQFLNSDEYVTPFIGYVEGQEKSVYQNITFEDPEVERICVENWADGEEFLSNAKVGQITSVGGVFYGSNIRYFPEFENFTSITGLTFASTKGCFGNCPNLEVLTLPKSLKTMGAYCINGTQIHSLVFKEGFTTLQNNALRNYNLTYIEFPSTLTTIAGGNFFANGTNLATNVVIKATTPPEITQSGCFQYYRGAYFNNTAAKIYVPYSSDHSILQAYQNSSEWPSIISRGINIYELDSNGNIPA